MKYHYLIAPGQKEKLLQVLDCERFHQSTQLQCFKEALTSVYQVDLFQSLEILKQLLSDREFNDFKEMCYREIKLPGNFKAFNL